MATEHPRPLRLTATSTPAEVARAELVKARLEAAGTPAEVVVHDAGDMTAPAVVLAGGAADAAVVAGDTLPVELADELVLASVPARVDPRDAIVSADGWGLATLPRARPVTVAASGAARRAQLQRHRRDVLLQDGLGSLADRLQALERGDLDATVTSLAELLLAPPAAPGLVVLPLEHGEVLHTPGQGTVVVLCRRSDAWVRKALARIDDPLSRVELDAELELRRQLSRVDDPYVGAHAEVRRSTTGQPRLVLLGLLTDATGSRSARASHETAPEEAITLGRAMAATLLEATAARDSHGH